MPPPSPAVERVVISRACGSFASPSRRFGRSLRQQDKGQSTASLMRWSVPFCVVYRRSRRKAVETDCSPIRAPDPEFKLTCAKSLANWWIQTSGP